MKKINKYILEKFKINSETIKKNLSYFDRSGSVFPKKDLDKISQFIRSLEILPDIIEVVDDGKSLMMKYDIGKDFVRIYISNYSNTTKDNYKVAFRKSTQDNSVFYPSFKENENFTLQECFDFIKDSWKLWKKYLESHNEKN